MDCLLAAIPIGKPKTRYTKLHWAILENYVTYLRTTSEKELPEKFIIDSAALKKISEPYAQELKKFVFTVPRLKKLLPEGQHRINKYRPVKEFISFLVRLLYQKVPSSIVDSCGDAEIKNLEKELRFLLTVLGDTSLLVCAEEHEEFENLLAEFEAVANEAGCFVHSLFFDRAFGELDEGTDAVLNHISLLKADIIKLSDVASCMSRSSHETSVVESLLVLDLLVRDLEDLMNNRDDDNSIADVKDQIGTLHQGVLCLQSFIKDTTASAQLSEIGEMRECYMQIGDLAHQAQHLIVSFLAGDAPPCYLVNRLVHINHKVELCRIELPDIMMKYTFGGLQVAKYYNKQLSLSLPKRSTVVDKDIVGYEDKMTYMLDHLVGGGAELRVISIFGMPGLGKTTLAKKLYNHPLVSERFDILSWCIISQTYLKRNVLANILINIASDKFGKDRILEMEEDSLVEHIHKTLKGRRYLIVMDDIWGSNVCDELFICFPDDGNESRILFTTRNKDVVSHNCIMYALPSLSEDQCWELIQKKVFNNQPCPPKLVGSGRELAASCRGMPLAAVVIAGILSTVDKEEREWEEVRRNLSSHILDGGDNSVLRILKLSYDHLPQHLKLCFLYLGVFFIDQEIPARDMMNLWIAEGFIHNENEKDAAEEYLKELIDKSLVIVSKRRSDGSPKTCLIHDLLCELCLKTCEEEKLTRFVNTKYFKNKEDHERAFMNSTTWMCYQYMPNHFGQHRRTSRYQIAPEMKLLRVLYLDRSFIYLNGIEYLFCLKYLVVADLPPSIGNLVNLEYLRVVSKKKVYLSSKVMKMKKLKYVDVAPKVGYGMDCNTSLTNKLEYLSYVNIWNVKDEKMLKCSPQLRRLKCHFYMRKICKRIDLSFFTRLESLALRVSRFIFGGSSSFVLSLPSSIKKLTLESVWSKLSHETLSMIGRLENLEILKLCNIQFEGNIWDTRDGEFQKLRYLRLHFISFTRWNVGSSQHFPKLQQLELSICTIPGGIPAEIGEIPTLEIIGVDRWHKRSARSIQEQQREMGNEDLEVVIQNYYKSDTAPDIIEIGDSIVSRIKGTWTILHRLKNAMGIRNSRKP